MFGSTSQRGWRMCEKRGRNIPYLSSRPSHPPSCAGLTVSIAPVITLPVRTFYHFIRETRDSFRTSLGVLDRSLRSLSQRPLNSAFLHQALLPSTYTFKLIGS